MLKKEYRDLEMKVLRTLREMTEKSDVKSNHLSTTILPVNIFGYTELAIVDDHLTFLDDNGLHYSLLSDCTLEDLIEIIEN